MNDRLIEDLILKSIQERSDKMKSDIINALEKRSEEIYETKVVEPRDVAFMMSVLAYVLEYSEMRDL